MRSSKFIKPLVDQKHLSKGLKAVCAPVWPFNSLDMFGLCNRGAESIWCTKLVDKVVVVLHGVLPG